MATLRIPVEMEPFLPYCRPAGSRRDIPKIFNTYADLVIFCAGYAFYRNGPKEPDLPKAFTKQTNPIDVQVFRSQGLFTVMMLIGIAATKGHEIANEEQRLVRLVEGFAKEGANLLFQEVSDSSPHDMTIELAKRLSEALEDHGIKI